MVMHVTVGTTIRSLFLWLRMNVTIHALEMEMKFVDLQGDSLFTDRFKSSILSTPKATTTTKTPTTIKTTADLITTVYETSGGVSETIPSS